MKTQVTMEGESFHKSCFKCAHGGCPLTHSNYAALDGVLYCKVHFQQLFMEKGNYQHFVDSANHKRSASSDAVEVPDDKSEDKAEAEAHEAEAAHEEAEAAKADSDPDSDKPQAQS